MQILCQPFFLLNLLILGMYYVLKIRRLQCYKYTLRGYSGTRRRSDFEILKIVGILMQVFDESNTQFSYSVGA